VRRNPHEGLSRYARALKRRRKYASAAAAQEAEKTAARARRLAKKGARHD